eukprot:1160121-Pelagomonas_calceolata.AAC.5
MDIQECIGHACMALNKGRHSCKGHQEGKKRGWNAPSTIQDTVHGAFQPIRIRHFRLHRDDSKELKIATSPQNLPNLCEHLEPTAQEG